MMNSETELKYSLSPKEFKSLKRFLASYPHYSKRQINTYFDSPSLGLKKKRIGLRIRTSNQESPTLTVKFPKSGKKQKIAALKVRYEYEEYISLKDAKAVLTGTKNILSIEALPIRILKRKASKSCLKELGKLGSLKTERTTYKYSKSFILELDRFTFFKKTFYELECETTHPKTADQEIKQLFKNLKIKYRPQKESKLARFLKEWQKKRA